MSEYMGIEETECFRLFVGVAGEVWDVVMGWPAFARGTMGEQLVRAADSVGANLAEGAGRFSFAEEVRFFVIARASARETRYWLGLARERGLIPAERADDLLGRLSRAARLLNGLIAQRRGQQEASRTRERADGYSVDPDCSVYVSPGEDYSPVPSPHDPNDQ